MKQLNNYWYISSWSDETRTKILGYNQQLYVWRKQRTLYKILSQ